MVLAQLASRIRARSAVVIPDLKLMLWCCVGRTSEEVCIAYKESVEFRWMERSGDCSEESKRRMLFRLRDVTRMLGLTCLSGCNLHRALPQRGEKADCPVRQVRSACVHCTIPTTEACGQLCLCALVSWLPFYAAPGSYQSTLGLRRFGW